MGVISGLTGLIGAGITAGSSTAATIATNQANKQIAQMNNAFNEKMMQKQMAYNKEMYQQQLGDQWQFYNDAKQTQLGLYEDAKDYNSAAAQRQRLQDAGLNPFLMMNGGNAGSVQSQAMPHGAAPSAQGVSVPTAAPYSVDYSGISSGLGHAIDAYTQLRSQKSTADKLDAETSNIRIEGKYKAAEMVAKISNIMQNTKSQSVKTYLDSLINGAQRDLLAAQIDKTKAETALNAITQRSVTLDNLAKSENLKVLPAQLRLSLSQQAADIAVRYAQKDLTQAQVKHEIARIANTITERDLIRSQTNKNVIDSNGAIQQQQYFSDTVDVMKRKLEADLEKAILNSGPSDPTGLMNFIHQSYRSLSK